MLTAASPTLPDALLDQLAEGGRLLLPEGSPHETQTLVRYVRTPKGITREALLDVLFVPLVSQAS